MKCNEETCKEFATKHYLHVGTNHVFYCLKHASKYCAVMNVMGCGTPIELPMDV